MNLCPYYIAGDKPGRVRPICRYIMQDLEGKWCLCSYFRMFLCEEWVKARTGRSLFEGEPEPKQKGLFD